jgi:hypothetical protein
MGTGKVQSFCMFYQIVTQRVNFAQFFSIPDSKGTIGQKTGMYSRPDNGSVYVAAS